jgi:hypothetical protein
MNVSREELIKWFDALDELSSFTWARGLQMARHCRHPDAVWLVSHFPAGEAVTRERMVEVMAEQRGDARAVFMSWKLAESDAQKVLERAAEMGYAAAQAQLASRSFFADSYQWAVKAAEASDRLGLYQLGNCRLYGWGCDKDKDKAIELYGQAAALEHSQAQFCFANFAFGEFDWERYLWWMRALERGVGRVQLFEAVIRLLPSFEQGHHSRILFIVAPAIRTNMDIARWKIFGERAMGDQAPKFARMVKLHEAMLARATDAIMCWSVVGLRLGLVKDMRVLIGKKAWEQAWHWGAEKKNDDAK